MHWQDGKEKNIAGILASISIFISLALSFLLFLSIRNQSAAIYQKDVFETSRTRNSFFYNPVELEKDEGDVIK